MFRLKTRKARASKELSDKMGEPVKVLKIVKRDGSPDYHEMLEIDEILSNCRGVDGLYMDGTDGSHFVGYAYRKIA